MATRVEPYVKVDLVIKDEPTRLAIDGSTNIGCVIVASAGPKMSYITSPEQLLANYTIDGMIPRNADITLINAYYMSFFAPLVVVRSTNSDVTGGVLVQMNSKSPYSVFSPQKAYFNNGQPLMKKFVVTIAPAVIEENAASDLGFIFDNVLYYAGNYNNVIAGLKAANGDADIAFEGLEAVDITPSADMGIATNFITEVNREGLYVPTLLNSVVTLYHHSDDDTPSLNVANGVPVAPYNMANMGGEDQNAVNLSGTHILSICSKDAQSTDFNGYSINISESRLGANNKVVFDLTLNGGDEDKTYLVSFDKEAVDASGANCYIENLNALQDFPFEVSVPSNNYAYGKEFTVSNTNTAFGAGLSSIVESAKIQYMIPALYELEDQEQYTINALAPLGITNLQFVKAMVEIGARNKWFCPCDVPYDRTNASTIANYGVQIPDSYSCMLLGPFDKNSGLLGWMTYIAASTLYWERVFRNKASNSEFAPVFDAQTGLMAYTNPVNLIKKSQREKLLSQPQPINFVLYDQALNSHYMNDNWTHYSLADNVMGEENAVRLSYKIAQDLNQIYKQFKAKQNTMSTRAQVVDVTNLYFKQNIMNQNFKPEEFLVICDRSNNTDDIINGRKLAITVKIRLYKSIKYITVLEEVYSVGGAAFQE